MKKRLLSAVLAASMVIGVVFAPETVFVPNAEAATKSAAQIKKELDAAVKKITALVPKGASDYEKIRILYKWMTENVKYDYNAYYNAYSDEKDYVNPYGEDNAAAALVGKLAMNEGYAEGYKLLLDKVGVESIMVVSMEMGHAWNQVKLDGKWYHCDTTWGVTDTGGKWNYFLLSDKEMSRDHTLTDAYYNKNSGRSYGVPKDFRITFDKAENQVADKSRYYLNNAVVSLETGTGHMEKRRIAKYDVKIGKTKILGKIWNDYELIMTDDAVVFVEFDGGYTTPLLRGGSGRIRRHDLKTGKTVTIGKGYRFDGMRDGYLTYSRFNEKKGDFDNELYNVEKNLKITIREDEELTFLGADGDLAFLCSFEWSESEFKHAFVLRVYNMKKSVMNEFRYLPDEGYVPSVKIGSYNGKVYFHSGFDLYCYDIKKKTFKKLKRPAGIKIPTDEDTYCVFDRVEIVKSGGKTYLKFTMWDVKNGIAKEIVKKREIK